MKQHMIKSILHPLKSIFKKLYYLIFDITHGSFKPDSMIPPRSKIFIGSGDFVKIGNEFKCHFIELANLSQDARILDVGCGIGRMAIPLTTYLSTRGEYWGFDIVQSGIKWCQKHISNQYPNFHFFHSNVFNKEYNPTGKIQAQNYVFPFENESFDFIFLTSVFTHMLPNDMENYLKEISRILKPDGKCMLTYFLINNDSMALINSGGSFYNFKHEIDNCLTPNINNPESAIAYKEELLIKLFNKHSLSVIQPIHYGNWCKRTQYLSHQDIIILEKTTSAPTN